MQRLNCCAPVFQLSLAVPSEGPWLSGSWLHRNQWSSPASVNRALPLPLAEYFIWSFPIMESTHNQISPNYLDDYPKSSRLTTRSLKPMAMTYHFRTPPWLATYYAIFHHLPSRVFLSKVWPFLEQEQNLLVHLSNHRQLKSWVPCPTPPAIAETFHYQTLWDFFDTGWCHTSRFMVATLSLKHVETWDNLR